MRYPSAPDVKLMLSLATADERQLRAVYRLLLVHYRANCTTLDRFCRARSDQERGRVLGLAAERRLATAPLLRPLRKSAEGLMPSGSVTA